MLNFNESQSDALFGDGISSFAVFSMLELFLSGVTSFSRDWVGWGGVGGHRARERETVSFNNHVHT